MGIQSKHAVITHYIRLSVYIHCNTLFGNHRVAKTMPKVYTTLHGNENKLSSNSNRKEIVVVHGKSITNIAM